MASFPVDLFRVSEKNIREYAHNHIKRRGKRKCGATSASNGMTSSVPNVINPHTFETCPDERLRQIMPQCLDDIRIRALLSRELKIFQLEVGPTGFFVIRNALTPSAQLFWAAVAVQRYSMSVHTNLTNLRHADSAASETPLTDASGADENEWALSVAENDEFQRFRKLRWASLGYHYDWTHRMYKQDAKSSFPLEFSILCQALAELAGLSILPEAGIINYYPLNAQMCGHLDDAEHCMTEPIVSVSLGCSGLFLLGGRTKDVPPIPLLLKSGDVVVMSGESRYCYHGVPVILNQHLEEAIFQSSGSDLVGPAQAGIGSPISSDEQELFLTEETINSFSSKDLQDWDAVRAYLKLFRVNMNSRRVTSPGSLWVDKNGSGYESAVASAATKLNTSSTV